MAPQRSVLQAIAYLRRLFQELFFAFLLFSFAMAAAYVWLLLQVWKSGSNLQFFSFTGNAPISSQYRKLVDAGRVPAWPLHFYWVAMIGSAFTFLGMVAALTK